MIDQFARDRVEAVIDRLNRLHAWLARSIDPGVHKMDFPDGPRCGCCGEPSGHESGWCGRAECKGATSASAGHSFSKAMKEAFERQHRQAVARQDSSRRAVPGDSPPPDPTTERLDAWLRGCATWSALKEQREASGYEMTAMAERVGRLEAAQASTASAVSRFERLDACEPAKSETSCPHITAIAGPCSCPPGCVCRGEVCAVLPRRPNRPTTPSSARRGSARRCPTRSCRR